MGINLIAPGSASPTGALFYDTGAFGATASMTKVAGVPVSAAVEIQSTQGALLLPRMTTTQRLAMTTVVDGMEVYDSTLGAFFVRTGTAWVQGASATSIQYASGTLTNAELRTTFSAPTALLAAPAAGFMYVVNGFLLSLTYGATPAPFVGGGNILLQYGVASNPGAGFVASGAIPSSMLTGAAVNKSSYVSGSITSTTTANGAAAPIAITNATVDFTVGTNGTASWKLWYSLVPVV
jgi:hypothetical protein